MGEPETSVTGGEMMGEAEKGEFLHVREEDVKVPRWKATGSRTYYCKVPPQYSANP